MIVVLSISSISATNNTNTTVNNPEDILQNNTNNSNQSIIIENNTNNNNDDNNIEDYNYEDIDEINTEGSENNLDSDNSKTEESLNEENNNKIPVNLVANDLVKYFLNDTALDVYLYDNNHNPLVNHKISITICGKTYNKTINSDGMARLNINLWPRIYNATIKYDGTSTYASASKKVTVTVLKRIPFFIDVSDNITPYEPFNFKLMDNQGYPLINKTVTLYCEGEKINLTSDSSGLCTYFLKLSPGYHNIYLNYNSNNPENSSAFSYGSIYINNFTKSFKIQDIINKAITLKNTIFENHTLPGNTTISDTNLSIFEFSYLMAKTISQIDDENTNETISLPYIYKAANYENIIFNNETLSYYTYIRLVNALVDFVEDNNYLPSYISNYTSTDIDFKTYTFCFSKILSFYNLSSFLPSKIYIESNSVNTTDETINYEFNDNYNFDSRFTNITNITNSYIGYTDDLTNTSIISEDYTFNYGSVYGKIRITDTEGRGLQNKILCLNVGNKSFNYTTDFWGNIYYNLNLYPGLYNLTAIFGGDKLFKTTTVKYSIRIIKSNITLLIKSDTLSSDNYLIFYMVNDEGFPVVNHTVTLNTDNGSYILKSDDLGYVKFNKTLPIGQNIINFAFEGDEAYNPLNYNFTLNVKDKTFIEGKDLIVKNGNRDLNIKLSSYNVNLVNETVIYKIIDQDLNLIRNLTARTNEEGIVQIPTLNINPGNYYILIFYMGNKNYLSSSKTFNLKIVTNETSIPTYVHSKNLIIHSKGEYFVGILTDQFRNPITDVPLSILFVNKNVTKNYPRITNENGTFRLQINMNNPNTYKVICKFEGNEIYAPVTTEFNIDAYYKPNLLYTINITSKNKITFHELVTGKDVVKNLTVPYGRLLGFYKNNKLYKYTYDYTESGATSLKNNKYYFFSLNDTKNITEVKKNLTITSVGFLLYSDGLNIFIRYLGYNKDKLYSLNVIYNGGKYSEKNICNVKFYYGKNIVASMFFSSEIYTSTTQNYLINNLKINVNSSNWGVDYQPVVTSISLNNHGKYNSFDFIHENINYIILSYGGVANQYLFNETNWTSKLGYEAIESILINTGVIINDDLMKNSTNNIINYTGADKIAYELYLNNLAYNWLMIKSFNEVSEEFNINWDIDNYYYLIESYLTVNGRCISVWNWTSAFYSQDYYNFKQSLNRISYITSILEEYVMGLNGDNSTCAVSEIILGLLNGEDFYLNNKNNTYFGLSDNTSYLAYTEYGGFGSYILFNYLNRKYKFNGGMILGSYNFLRPSKIINNLKNILKSEIHNIYSTIYNQVYSRIKNKDVKNLVNYIYEDVSNPRMLSGIAGGFMVNAGLIMTLSGAGAIVGVPLLVAGTICTAYSSGLINVDKKTKKISMNFTQRNELEFGISMGLDACDLGSEYNVVSKSVKTKSVVKAIKTVRP
ncbi:MAG: hypothetical protein MR750_08105, partial [Methanobrevibacter boviskoreani]